MAAVTSRLLLHGEFVVLQNQGLNTLVKASKLNASTVATFYNNEIAIAVHLDSRSSIPVCLDLLNKSLFENHQISLYNGKFQVKIIALEDDSFAWSQIQLLKKPLKLINIYPEIDFIKPENNSQMIFYPSSGKTTSVKRENKALEFLQAYERRKSEFNENSEFGDFDGTHPSCLMVTEAIRTEEGLPTISETDSEINETNFASYLKSEKSPIKDLSELIATMLNIIDQIKISLSKLESTEGSLPLLPVELKISQLKELIKQKDFKELFHASSFDEAYLPLLEFLLYNQHALKLNCKIESQGFIKKASLFKNDKAVNLINRFFEESSMGFLTGSAQTELGKTK